MTMKKVDLNIHNIDQYVRLQKTIKESRLKMIAMLFLIGFIFFGLYSFPPTHATRNSALAYLFLVPVSICYLVLLVHM